jgi:hypothetical protein
MVGAGASVGGGAVGSGGDISGVFSAGGDAQAAAKTTTNIRVVINLFIDQLLLERLREESNLGVTLSMHTDTYGP